LRKNFFGLILFGLIQAQYLFSFDIETASKIYDKLFYAVFEKTNIKVFVNDDEYKQMILSSKNLVLSESINMSDIVIVTSENDLINIQDKVAFAIEKSLLEKNTNIIGAFYWNKGRPEIIFIKDRLAHYNLKITESFEKYVK
jgi:hypothetical protein